MSVSFNARIPTMAFAQKYLGSTAVETMEEIIFNWMPIYTSFVEPLNSINREDGLDCEAVLGLTHDTSSFYVRPVFVSTDLVHAGLTDLDHPVGTVNDAEAFGDWGLGGDLIMEPVAFDSDIFFDTLKYGTNAGMLRKMVGKWNTVRVKAGHSYNFHSNNFTQPSVKRINDYTFCGILFHLPQAGSTRQPIDGFEITGTVAQLQINMNVHYDEWNPNFDQTAI